MKWLIDTMVSDDDWHRVAFTCIGARAHLRPQYPFS